MTILGISNKIPKPKKPWDAIKSIITDNYDRLWFGTDYSGLFYIDLKSNRVFSVPQKGIDSTNNVNHSTVTSLEIGAYRNLWIGTFGNYIRNHISNAIKFTQHGGTIEIKVEEKYQEVEICVSDSRVGMDEET
jgi:light-regulated signal transduction histidine kinase (bacteriophytochrome)